MTKEGGRFQKGHIPWNKGKVGVQIAWNKGTRGEIHPNGGSFKNGHAMPEETRKKISETMKGKPKNYPVWNEGRGRIECLYCKKTFKRGHKRQVFCSIECRSLNFRGEKAPNWKGGKAHREEYSKRWKKENHEKVLHYTRKRRIKKHGNGGYHSLIEWLELKSKYHHACPACNRKEPEIMLTVDHIEPIAKGGSDNIENIQPLCGSCNSKKHLEVIVYA